MTTDLARVIETSVADKTGRTDTFLMLGPKAMVNKAAEIATVLRDVIDKQGLYSNISGKKYVKHEGWSTLGTILGILPREQDVIELADGSYQAKVELYNLHTDQIVGQASAICGMDEKRWRGADRYARRSMAVTRATGKAYRLGFGWIMALAGYEATPSEEMSDISAPAALLAPSLPPPIAQPPSPAAKMLFDKHNTQAMNSLRSQLKTKGLENANIEWFADALHGNEIKEGMLDKLIVEHASYTPVGETELEVEIPF